MLARVRITDAELRPYEARLYFKGIPTGDFEETLIALVTLLIKNSGDLGRVLINAQMSSFGDEAEILCVGLHDARIDGKALPLTRLASMQAPPDPRFSPP
jgi:hypothetical protein